MSASVKGWIRVKTLLQEPASALVAKRRRKGSSSSNTPYPHPHPHPVPDSYLLSALAHPIHSSETNKEAGPLATARTQERSKEMMFGKDKAGV